MTVVLFACFVQMFEAEESGAVVEDEFAVILKSVLGVEDLAVGDVFRAVDRGDKGKITFGNYISFQCKGETVCRNLWINMVQTYITDVSTDILFLYPI